jgi:hypothetical protein
VTLVNFSLTKLFNIQYILEHSYKHYKTSCSSSTKGVGQRAAMVCKISMQQTKQTP